MEEDLNEEFEDYNFESDNPVVKFLFLFLEYVKDNRTFTKPSVKRRDMISKAKYSQKMQDLQNKF